MATDTHPNRAAILALGWGVVAALAVVVTWGRGIAMDLMLTVMSVVDLFGDAAVLPFEPDWTGAGLRALATAVMAAVAWRVIRYQRISRGACGRCGRDGGPVRDRRRAARWAAWLTLPPALGYGALKIGWAFGATIGLADVDIFAGVEPWSPGFADTGVMAAVGIGIALAMAYRRPRLPRWLLLTPALIGCAMLLPVAVLGTIGNIADVHGAGFTGGLETWVFWFVYTCFAIWGAGLAVVTLEYHYGTRGRCRVCGRA